MPASTWKNKVMTGDLFVQMCVVQHQQTMFYQALMQNQHTHLDFVAEQALGQGVVELHTETDVVSAVVLLYTALLAARVVAGLADFAAIVGAGPVKFALVVAGQADSDCRQMVVELLVQ